MHCALLLESDLFFSVKVTDILRRSGVQTRTVRRLDDFVRALAEDSPAIALVNIAARGLDWAGGIAAAQEAGVPCIAYGPHVDVAAQETARRAGAARILSNSALAAQLPGAARRMLGPEGSEGSKLTPPASADDQW